ncbi:50S ribosomal protein L21 [Janibacter corallicola]|uniref:50S ribosomal protein L21 n=1 Tax=Janibacter corallicola TaxID=415212 RepID=UPI00082A3A0F|nr:50S ribosomal protein L21 [Janibacter corallicola]
MYAIVRAGGRQEKVSVGDTILINKIAEQAGQTVSLEPVLLVDGATVTSGTDKLAGASVTAEVVGAAKGPKVNIVKYKNKTGYRKRQGHRQALTELKITDIKA